jgi:hypothetical protein
VRSSLIRNEYFDRFAQWSSERSNDAAELPWDEALVRAG